MQSSDSDASSSRSAMGAPVRMASVRAPLAYLVELSHAEYFTARPAERAQLAEAMLHIAQTNALIEERLKNQIIDTARVAEHDLAKVGIAPRAAALLTQAGQDARLERIVAEDAARAVLEELHAPVQFKLRPTREPPNYNHMFVFGILLVSVKLLHARRPARVASMFDLRTAKNAVPVADTGTAYTIALTGSMHFLLLTHPEALAARVPEIMGGPPDDMAESLAEHQDIGFSVILVATDQHEDFGVDIPQATMQALLAMERTGAKEVRFCITNGRKWMPGVLSKDEEGRRRCVYQASVLELGETYLTEGLHKIAATLASWMDGDDRLVSETR